MNENSGSNVCPKCQAPIPAEAPQGLCPRCVLAGAADAGEAPYVGATGTGEIPTIERIATAFPQLEIIELIGRGGMGFVFKARQPHLDRFVALKLLPDKLAKDPHFAERFNREGRVLAKLSHPNIVGVFDFGEAGSFYYLLMEYVDGVNLRQAMRAGRFSPTEALGIVPHICGALQYAHDQGVLHRDIKPENILLDAKGRVKIADFGIAKLVGEDAPSITLTGTGSALGTPHYMAPEQLEKPNQVDHRADIYSLGVVFYEMLTGELPIGRFAPPSERTPMDDRVDRIVMRALEKERELRQKNAGEFKTEVEHVAAHPQPPGATKGGRRAAPAVPWWHHIVRGLVGGATVLLTVLLATVAVTLFLPKSYEARARIAFTKPTPAAEPQWVLGSGPDGVRSSVVLSNAAAELNLKKRWSSRYSGKLSDAQLLQLLRNVTDVRQVRSTSLYEIRCSSNNADEAADLANAVAHAFCAGEQQARIVEVAEIPTTPVRPSLGLNSAIGAFVGLLLGALGAVVLGLLSWRNAHLAAKNPPAVGPHGTWIIDEKAAARGAASRSFAPWRVVPRWATAVLLVLGVAVGIGAWSRTRDYYSGHRTETLQLSRGTIDLASVASYPSDAPPWKPDGRPASEGGFEPLPHAVQPSADERGYQFFFHVKPPASGASTPQFLIEHANGWSGTSQPKVAGEVVNGGFLVAAKFPKNVKRTSIKAGLAVDPWESVMSNGAQSQGSSTVAFMGQRVKLQFLAAVQDQQTNTVVNVIHNVRDLDYRVVAVSEEGVEIPSLLSDSTRDHLSATFVNLPLSRIQEFRFQVRPYRWVEFRRVALEPKSEPAVAADPIQLRFRVAKGQVATFQLVRADVEPNTPVERASAFFAAPSDERARGEFHLLPDKAANSKRTWRMRLAAEEGPEGFGASVELGELLSSIQPPPNNFWEIRPDSEIGIQLTHAHPMGAEATSTPARAALHLVVRSVAYSNAVPGSLQGATVSMGSTNWLQSLRDRGLPQRKPADTSAWVRYTFTAVEMRTDAKGRWLAIDYVPHENGSVERGFRVDANIVGFTPQTRKTEFMLEAKNGAPEIRHQRIEFLMPSFMSDRDLQQFRDDLAKGMVRQSIVAHAGQEQPVFKLPVGNRGTLGGWVGAVLATNQP